MQGHFRVGAVQRFATPVCFAVDGIAGANEGGDIGNRITDPIAVTSTLDVHRLVQVHRTGGINGGQRYVGAVEIGQPGISGRALGSLFHVIGKRNRQVHLLLDRGDSGRERGRTSWGWIKASCG